MRHNKAGRPIGPKRGRSVKGLAARIVAKRLALGLSQARTANVLGIARETLARWELGREPRGLYRVVLERWLRRTGGSRGK